MAEVRENEKNEGETSEKVHKQNEKEELRMMEIVKDLLIITVYFLKWKEKT